VARTFLIDTDTASDDAVALVMALRHPDVRVAAITVVSGNVPLHLAVRNALISAELCGSEVPVYAGADRPLLRPASFAQHFHGMDGLGDQGYADPRGTPQAQHAVEAMIETIRAHPGLTLVTLGPLTNVALAVSRAPGIVDLVERCVVMGGAANTVGNSTPAAEFNIWHDPDAAAIVFRSGLPIEMVGWELCRFEAALDEAEIAATRAIGTPLAEFAVDCNATAIAATARAYGTPSLPLPDPVAMAVAIDPTICTRASKHRVEIETASDLTRGMTVVDQLNVTRRRDAGPAWALAGEATICWEIDIPHWKRLLRESLS
jgi:purine nucleosidase